MEPDDHVCLCFRVSLRKLTHYIEREQPSVASQLSECLGAGTGCHWCVPQLERLHAAWREGQPLAIPGNPGDRVLERARWRQAKRAGAANADEPDTAAGGSAATDRDSDADLEPGSSSETGGPGT